MKLFFTLIGVFLLSYNTYATEIDFNNAASLKKSLETQQQLAPLLALKLATIQIENNQTAEARALLTQKVTHPVWSFWKNVLLAKASLKEGKTVEVQNELSVFPPEPNPDNNLNQTFYRTLYHEALLIKDDTASKKLDWALFPEFNENTPVGISIVEKAKRLRALAALGKTDTIPNFISVGDITSAHLDLSVQCKALDDLGSILRKNNKTDDTLQAYNAVITHQCQGEPLIKASYWKAKILSQMGNADNAIQAYKDFIKKFPDHQYTDDAHYALVTLYKKAGKDHLSDESQKNLLGLSKGDMKNRYLFDAGFENFEKGKFKKAIEFFDNILRGTPTGDESHPQALYWKARALEKMGGKDLSGAKTCYHELARRYPFSFYAVLSSNRLKQKFTLPVSSPNTAESTSSTAALEIFATLASLEKIEAITQAQDVLDYYTQSVPGDVSDKTLIQKWAEAHDFNQSITLASRELSTSLFAVDLNPSSPIAWAFYPKPFETDLITGAKLSGLPKGAIAGIMREESLFRPSVFSSAGAVGLMQLMPTTASMQSRKIAMNGFNTSLLTDPQTNIKLGATFFADMVDTFKGSYPLAIMAYNAGPGNVRKWLKTNGHLPLDEFVENIPFSETRGYIKRVLRSMQVYGVLYGDQKLQEPFVDFKLPSL
ncbi:transglycosylase SLT domain-containing protein [bacterium]|nr:transglycosylase SLT domain-containing protein [bacterium]